MKNKILISLICSCVALNAQVLKIDDVNLDKPAIQFATLSKDKGSLDVYVKRYENEKLYYTESEKYYVLYLVNIKNSDVAKKRLNKIHKSHRDAKLYNNLHTKGSIVSRYLKAKNVRVEVEKNKTKVEELGLKKQANVTKKEFINKELISKLLPPKKVEKTKEVKKTKLKPKRSIKGNMNLTYNTLPGVASSLNEMFENGVYYGRLRSNTFLWDWGKEIAGKQKDNKNMGVGASFIYKTAYLNGFAATAGLYSTYNPEFYRMDKSDVGYSKSGKDTFSRNNVSKDNHYGMAVLAQSYLEYNKNKTNVKLGRQLFHSVFTKSNDTKMIPNTFDGITFSNKSLIPKTTIRAAYFTAQKLRDHTTSHDLVTFKTSDGSKWDNNDDSAIHKGLSYSNFVAAGEDTKHEMIIIDAKNKSVKNLVSTLSYLQVPGVVKDIVAEAHYKMPIKNGWAIRPGFRYFLQIDDGAGAVAGDTNLKGKAAIGYNSSVRVDNSLDSSLLALRVDAIMPNKKGFFRVGYSAIEDKADILAPWRGFPTGGFSRAMAQYNWYANTKTYMLRAAYKFTPKFNASLRYAIQDFDDAKDNVQADSTIWHLDTVTKLAKSLEMKTRIGIVSADDNIINSSGSAKTDVSYNEYRLEFNYLF